MNADRSGWFPLGLVLGLAVGAALGNGAVGALLGMLIGLGLSTTGREQVA